jgi:GNAT superfamily N-acetyltransferase
MLGPMNVSTNYDCGLLLDAYDQPPFLLTTYNPPYYVRLIERCGQTKAKDLLAWSIDVTQEVPERVQRLAEKFRKREDLTVRPIRLNDMANEIEKIKRIYNDAWEQNWGAVPMTDDEFHHMAKDMKQLVVPELFLIAEVKGDPVAFAMTLPDVNRALAKIDGRLFPFGLVKLLWNMRKIRACRLIALGIRKGYRKRGIDSILYNDTLKNAQKLGYTDGEVSWTLEDNDLINRAIELMGAKRSKTYRVYEGAV